MKRLHVLILKSFIGPFILIFFIVLFILLMQFLWRYIDDLVGKGLELKIIVELLIFTSSSLVPMALPLSILMASLMTLGNMGEFYELTAIKASGISLQRVLTPLMVFIIFVSIGAFFFANDVLPYTNLKMRSLLYDVRNQRPEIQIVPGSFYNGIDGYSLRVERKDPNTNMLYDVKIYDHSQHKGNTSVIIADSGKLIVTEDERYLIFTLYNGFSYTEVESERKARRNKSYPHRYDTFDEQEMIIELFGFSLDRTDESLFKNHYSMLNLSQLGIMADSIQKEISRKEKVLANTLIKGNYFRKHNYKTSKRKDLAILADSLRQYKGRNTPYGFNRINDTNRFLLKNHAFGKQDSSKPESQFSNLADQQFYDTLEAADTLNDFSEILIDNQTIAKQQIDTFKHATAIYSDSLIAQLTIKEKDVIISEALSYARSARTYTSNSIQSIDSKIKRLRRFEIERQRKYTIAFSCFIFLLIGAPLGAIIRKGGLGLPLVISTLFFIFYYIISLIGEKTVRESVLPDYQGMWLSNAVFFVIGVFLTYKATTDSAILNLDTYANFFKKLVGIRKKTMLEVLEKENRVYSEKIIRHEKITASLTSFRDTINELNEDVNTRIKFSGYLLSLIGLREISNIILFKRLYDNIIYSIKQSGLYQDHAIRIKLNEFPDFKYQDYLDQKAILFIRLILLLIPPLSIIILIRHYVQFMMLKARLKNIDQLTGDLINLVKKSYILNN